MQLKSGVSLSNLQPQMVVALLIAEGIWETHGTELVVTSANDGRHSLTSLHYAGAAVDLCTKTLTNAPQASNELATALGIDFDVILEDHGEANEHLHAEYQPRRLHSGEGDWGVT